MESLIFKVRPTKEEEFAKIVKKFNRCLKASGLSEVQPILLGKCAIDIKVGATNLHYSVEGNQYQLSFPDEMLGMKGYTFIGEYRRIDGKWHRTMHSSDIKDELEVCEANMRCDHCGRNIRNRNGYFFFRDPNGALTVVGSTCVDAFLGFNVRELLLALGDATEFERSCGSPDFDREVIGIGIESFVAMVSDETCSFTGWKRKSSDDSTAQRLKSRLLDMFFGKGKPIPELADAKDVVSKCRDYWNTQYKFDDLSVNSRKALETEFVPLRWTGIAGWAVYKAVSESRKPAAPVQNPTGEFVGNVGDIIIGSLIPRKYIRFENKWGVGYAVHFDDKDGNHYLTFTSSSKFMDRIKSSIGKEIALNFTIVAHETDHGRNTTKIKSIASR